MTTFATPFAVSFVFFSFGLRNICRLPNFWPNQIPWVGVDKQIPLVTWHQHQTHPPRHLKPLLASGSYWHPPGAAEAKPSAVCSLQTRSPKQLSERETKKLSTRWLNHSSRRSVEPAWARKGRCGHCTVPVWTRCWRKWPMYRWAQATNNAPVCSPNVFDKHRTQMVFRVAIYN